MPNNDFQNGFILGATQRGVITTGSGSGGTSDYEQLTNKPFYKDTTTITIDKSIIADPSTSKEGFIGVTSSALGLEVGDTVSFTLAPYEGSSITTTTTVSTTVTTMEADDPDGEVHTFNMAMVEDDDTGVMVWLVDKGMPDTGFSKWSVKEDVCTFVAMGAIATYSNVTTTTKEIAKSTNYSVALQPDWEADESTINFIRNKPFGETITELSQVTFTIGGETGATSFEAPFDMTTLTTTVSGSASMEGEITDLTYTYAENSGFQMLTGMMEGEEEPIIQIANNYEGTSPSSLSPKEGSWFAFTELSVSEGDSIEFTINKAVKKEVIKKIDEKYLPATKTAETTTYTFRNEPYDTDYQPTISTTLSSFLDSYPNSIFSIAPLSGKTHKLSFIPSSSPSNNAKFEDNIYFPTLCSSDYKTVIFEKNEDGDYEMYPAVYSKNGDEYALIPTPYDNYSVEIDGYGFADINSYESDSLGIYLFTTVGSDNLFTNGFSCETAFTPGTGKLVDVGSGNKIPYFNPTSYTVNNSGAGVPYFPIGNTPAEILSGLGGYYTYTPTLRKHIKCSVHKTEHHATITGCVDKYLHLSKAAYVHTGSSSKTEYTGNLHSNHIDFATEIFLKGSGDGEDLTRSNYLYVATLYHGTTITIRSED